MYGIGRVESNRSLCRSVAKVCQENGIEHVHEDALLLLGETVAARIQRACSLMKEKMETGRGLNHVKALMECMKGGPLPLRPFRAVLYFLR